MQLGLPNEIRDLKAFIKARNELKVMNNYSPKLSFEDDALVNEARHVGAINDSKIIPEIDKYNKLIQSKVTDEQLVKLTGLNRKEMGVRLEELKNTPETVKKTPEAAFQAMSSQVSSQEMNVYLAQMQQQTGEPMQNIQEVINYMRRNNLTLEQMDVLRGSPNPQETLNMFSSQNSVNRLSTINLQRPQNYRTNRFNLNRNSANSFNADEYIMNDGLFQFNKSRPTLTKFITSKLPKPKTQFLSEIPEVPETQNLLPELSKSSTEVPAAKILAAYKKLKAAPKGMTFNSASSLSVDSQPLTIDMMNKALKDNLGKVNFHGFSSVNPLGYPTKLGLDNNIIMEEMNTHISKLNLHLPESSKIPYSYIQGENIYYPKVSITKFKLGGTIGGGWLDKFEDGGEVLEDPAKPKTTENPDGYLTASDYQRQIKDLSQNYLTQMNYESPPFISADINTSDGDKNCINGVCQIIKGSTGMEFNTPNKTYIGNSSFDDDWDKNGFYNVSDKVRETGFQIGDVVQYSREKGNVLSRFDGEITPKNTHDLVPNHAEIIIDMRKGDDGQTYYTIVHNGGTTKFKEPVEITQEELYSRMDGYHTYDGLIVSRYDPEAVALNKKKLEEEKQVLAGNNTYAKLYNSPPNFTVKKETGSLNPDLSIKESHLGDYPEADRLLNYYKKNYQNIGKSSDLSPDILNQLFQNQIGIAYQESNFGTNLGIKQLIPDSLVPTARKLVGSDGDDWITDYWDNNANKVQSKYKTKEEFIKYLHKDDIIDQETKNYIVNNSSRSTGEFQQKELSKRGRYFNLNFDTEENQFLASMNLSIDNYHIIDDKYPDLSVQEKLDLTTLMHNAPGKALTPEYVDYYLKNKNIDYVNKVNRNKGIIVQSTENKITSKPKISTEEQSKISNWLDKYEDGRTTEGPPQLLPNNYKVNYQTPKLKQ